MAAFIKSCIYRHIFFLSDSKGYLLLYLCTLYLALQSIPSVFSLVFPLLCVFFCFPQASLHHREINLLFDFFQCSPASFRPNDLVPRKRLSRRIHLTNPRASHFITSPLKACLTHRSKWRIVLVDHHQTILCHSRVNSVLSVLFKPVCQYMSSCTFSKFLNLAGFFFFSQSKTLYVSSRRSLQLL